MSVATSTRKAVTTLAEVEKAFSTYKSALSALGEVTSGWELAVIPGKGFRIFGASQSEYPTAFANKEDAAATMNLWATVVAKVSQLLSKRDETPEVTPEEKPVAEARKASQPA